MAGETVTVRTVAVVVGTDAGDVLPPQPDAPSASATDAVERNVAMRVPARGKWTAGSRVGTRTLEWTIRPGNC